MGTGAVGEKSVLMECYNEGRAAFMSNATDHVNPYPSGSFESFDQRRLHWFKGYEEARIWNNVGHVFRKHKIEWP